MKRALLLLVLVCVLVGAGVSSAGGNLIYPGDWSNMNRGLTAEDFPIFNYKDTYLNDGLYIQIRFDDGTFLFGSFFIYKAGPFSRNGLFFTYVNREGKRLLFKEEVPDEKVEHKGTPYLWRASKSYISGDGQNWRLVIKCQGLDADLYLRRLTPGWKPGNGKAVMDEKKNLHVMSVMMVPATRVEGTIHANGKTFSTPGYGYVDRTYQNMSPTHYAPVALSTYTVPDPKAAPEDRWFLDFGDNYGHQVFNKVHFSWLILIRNDKIVFTSKDLTTKQEDFRNDPSINEKSPFRFVVQAKQGADYIQFTAQGDRIIDSLDVFSELPDYVKKVALKFLKRPVYFRLASTVKGTLHQNGQTIPFHSVGMSGTVYIK